MNNLFDDGGEQTLRGSIEFELIERVRSLNRFTLCRVCQGNESDSPVFLPEQIGKRLVPVLGIESEDDSSPFAALEHQHNVVGGPRALCVREEIYRPRDLFPKPFWRSLFASVLLNPSGLGGFVFRRPGVKGWSAQRSVDN